MSAPSADTEALLRRASDGDAQAVEQLFSRHRNKLRQMVVVRMDHRLARRFDPSDVVQEAIAEASRKLPNYLCDRPLPFYPWLRRLAWQRLVDLYRQHVQAQRRSVTREQEAVMEMSDRSALLLADRLASSQSSPSRQIIQRELRQRTRDALDRLRLADREVLVLMYLEQLYVAETSAVLGISEKAVTMRHLRALDRLRSLLVGPSEEGP
jgi:RNA polymerase sigma-70 factor (ECF subfamily)